MDIERKSVEAAVSPVQDAKSKHGEFDVILSTSALDRDGDELHPDEWKTPLPDKITFDSDHGMSVATCVGSGKPFINDDGQLQVRGTFASTPHGQAVRTLVNEGHIDSVSVAFRNLPKKAKDAKPQRELLNAAFVAVPANPEARVLSSKSLDESDVKTPEDVKPEDLDIPYREAKSEDEQAETQGDSGVAAKGAKKTDHDSKEPYGSSDDAGYADPGFRDNVKRYPLKKNGKFDAERVRAAWDYFHHAHDRDMYSREEQAHIERAIEQAAKEADVHLNISDGKAPEVDPPIRDAYYRSYGTQQLVSLGMPALYKGGDAANYRVNEMGAISDMFQNDPLDGGNYEQRPEYWQGVHDLAIRLGAGCPYSDPQATPGVLQSSNRSVDSEEVHAKALPETEEHEAESADESAERKQYWTLDDIFAFLDKHQHVKGVKNARRGLAGVDAVLDEAVKLTADANREDLPEPVAQALDLLTSAHANVGKLMEELGIFDPDSPGNKSLTSSPELDDSDTSTDIAPDSAADTGTDTDKSIDEVELRAKMLAISLQSIA